MTHKARLHAITLAVILWVFTLVSTFGGTGLRSLAGPLNGIDFVQFYTLGHLARAGRIAEAYDPQAFHTAQAALVPESAEYIYPPVYPPQTALLFIPFSLLSYGAAALAWVVLSILLYAAMISWAWRSVSHLLQDRALVFAAAAGFPPFWEVVVTGQTTILILGACFAAWVALERRQHFLAGCALGLLAIKPQFGLPFAAIVLARRDWAMLGGAVASVAAQAALVWAVLGTVAFSGYASMVPVILSHADLLEAKPFQSHSIRAITRLLPSAVGVPLWVTLVGLVLWRTARTWIGDAPLDVRFGLVMLAAVLVNPHVIIYDAAILALPLLWFAAWFQRDADPDAARNYGYVVYAVFATLFMPTAAVVKIQASVLVMLWLFWTVDRHSQPVPAESLAIAAR